MSRLFAVAVPLLIGFVLPFWGVPRAPAAPRKPGGRNFPPPIAIPAILLTCPISVPNMAALSSCAPP